MCKSVVCVCVVCVKEREWVCLCVSFNIRFIWFNWHNGLGKKKRLIRLTAQYIWRRYFFIGEKSTNEKFWRFSNVKVSLWSELSSFLYVKQTNLFHFDNEDEEYSFIYFNVTMKPVKLFYGFLQLKYNKKLSLRNDFIAIILEDNVSLGLKKVSDTWTLSTLYLFWFLRDRKKSSIRNGFSKLIEEEAAHVHILRQRHWK